MRAWLLESLGGLDRLKLDEIADPRPGEGEVVLEVLYAGLNPADRYLAEGQYPARPAFPHILGRDGVGIVRQLGPGVTRVKVGQKAALLRGEVGVSRRGTFAQLVAAPVDDLVDVPPGWTDPQAASTLVYLTAYQALTQWGPLPPGIVLITGASGGVGVASVQLAHALGHTVVGLSRSREKSQKLMEIGADAVFDPQDTQWRRKLRDFSGEKRVDLAIDNIGGALLPDVIDTLGYMGKISVVGRLAGPVPQFNTATLFFRRIRIGGVAVGSFTNVETRAAWAEILKLLERSSAQPLVDRVFPFEQLPSAFERLAAGPMGKVVLAVGGPLPA